jgi:hypothetical protein
MPPLLPLPNYHLTLEALNPLLLLA